MFSPEPIEETFIVICGGGPTGAVLSALLGRMNVPNIVLERELEITTDPRGIALDEDGIRIVQAIGMYERVFTQIGQSQKMHFISGSGTDLMKSPLLTIDNTTSEGGTGHPGFVFHKQPRLEQALRDAVRMSSKSEFRCGATITAIADCDKHVEVEYKDSQGSPRRLKARYLVGADGKTGFVRKNFLEPKGVLMEYCDGTRYEEWWVAINWHITAPTPETHPEFPLWKLNYTPEQVYDAFFPVNFRFVCNPNRPSVCGRFGLVEDRLWRFEFVVAPGEDPQHMARDEVTSKIIRPYIIHPGSRYGLPDRVAFPTDCIHTLRSRPFKFSARSCNRWAENRVIVAGDAAHVFPPFGGQGIASGFRDSMGLAWRFAVLHREPSVDHVKLLEAWYVERKQQLERSLASTIRNGEYVTEGDPLKSFIRDWSMWAMQLIPSWRREFEKGPRAEGMTKYNYQAGLPFIPQLHGGSSLPQVYCKDLVTAKLEFTDDSIFAQPKRGLFQILALVDCDTMVSSAMQAIQGLRRLSKGWVQEDEATILVHDMEAHQLPKIRPAYGSVIRIASAEEATRDPMMCKNRPVPMYYRASRIQTEFHPDKKFILIRPDRFVYAACSNKDELRDSVRQLLVDLALG